jgi:hypothetical protein
VTDIPSKKETYNVYINLSKSDKNEVPIFQDPAQIEKILKHARIFHCFELPYMTCTFDKSTEFMDI